MAFKVHEVKKYSYSFDARVGGIGGLQLWSDHARILTITFVEEGAQVPPPVLAADLDSAHASFKRSALQGLVDMLRNEGPVSVTLNNQPPGFVFVHTGFEPVMEGETV
jgi:hypothetical protein